MFGYVGKEGKPLQKWKKHKRKLKYVTATVSSLSIASV
jgi:hypothetical protein